MYGFIRIYAPELDQLSINAYKNLYCGQCAAIQNSFGYFSRACVSYDAAFIGLLVAAQVERQPESSKCWCAMAPTKKCIFEKQAKSQAISSSFALLFAYIKQKDREQEGEGRPSRFSRALMGSAFERALGVLSSYGFSKKIVDDALIKQKQLEEKQKESLDEYAEPSGVFLGEVFRFTASVSKSKENLDLLYELGHELGKLIYLVDACLDIREDFRKKKFNAFIAAFGGNPKLVQDIGKKKLLARLANYSTNVEYFLKNVRLNRYYELTANILRRGVCQEVSRRAGIEYGKAVKLIPDWVGATQKTLLGTVLCLYAAHSNAADWYWGDVLYHPHSIAPYKAYGWVCCDKPKNECPNNCPIWDWMDCLFNPLHIRWYHPGHRCCHCLVQLPKSVLPLGVAASAVGGLGAFLRSLHVRKSVHRIKPTTSYRTAYSHGQTKTRAAPGDSSKTTAKNNTLENGKEKLASIEDSIRSMAECLQVEIPIDYCAFVDSAAHLSAVERVAIVKEQMDIAEKDLKGLIECCESYNKVRELQKRVLEEIQGDDALEERFERLEEELFEAVDTFVVRKDWESFVNAAQEKERNVSFLSRDAKSRSRSNGSEGDASKKEDMVNPFFEILSEIEDIEIARKMYLKLRSNFHPDKDRTDKSTPILNKQFDLLQKAWAQRNKGNGRE